ncbi:MAG: NAD-binding protein [Actinobacteria bacterium]|nr:NAD-binding protein [Actinomycetota bacterium]
MTERKGLTRLINFEERLRLRILDKGAYIILVTTIVAVFFAGSALTFHFEKGTNPEISTYGDSIWLTIVTVTTVGYGDAVPVTRGGRTSCFLIMVFGIGALSIFISTRASKQVEKTRRRFSGLEKSINTWDHFLICGWNSRGEAVITRLRTIAQKHKIPIVLMCDMEEMPIDDDYVYFLRGSAVNEKDLKRANVGKAKSVVLLANEQPGMNAGGVDAITILSALSIKAMNPDISITAEVLEPENVYHMEKAGVSEILEANTLLGNLMARSAYHHGLISIISDLAGAKFDSRFISVTADQKYVGKSFAELQEMLKGRGDDLVGIKTANNLIREENDYRVAAGDSIIIMTEKEAT